MKRQFVLLGFVLSVLTALPFLIGADATSQIRSVATSTYSVDSTSFDNVLALDSTSNAIAVALPPPTVGRILTFLDAKGQFQTHNVTVTHNAAETINGATSLVLVINFSTCQIISDGTNWFTTQCSGAQANANRTGWTYLGKVTATTAVRTGVLSWTGNYQQLAAEHFIAGYSGAAIARVICGPAAGLTETGANFNSGLIENVTLTTSSINVSGWATAVATAAATRWGWMYIDNQQTVVKRMVGQGQYAGTAPGTPPTMIQFAGMFNDTTNFINQCEMATYLALTGNAVSSVTMNPGTYLAMWGRNFD